MASARRVLKHNYHIIFSAFKYIQSRSDAFPNLSFKSILEFFKVDEAKEHPSDGGLIHTSTRVRRDTINKSPREQADFTLTKDGEDQSNNGEIISSESLSEVSKKELEKKEIDMKFIEGAFEMANHCSRSGLGGSLHRAEFLHFLVRLVKPCESY